MSKLPTISHPAVGATSQPNFTEVRTGDLTLWFSYSTVVGFHHPTTGTIVHENVWGVTTGKHLNWISRDKTIRVSSETFNDLLGTVVS